ncbi:hypothetical protein RCL1_008669 [Eukaryota sp. TZLM3-RCL]
MLWKSKKLRETIPSIFSKNDQQVAFYDEGSMLNSIAGCNTIILREACNDSGQNTAYVSHMLDGQLIFKLKNYGEGSSIKFLHPNTKQVTGFEFVKRTMYSQHVDQVKVLGKTQRLSGSSCSLTISFNLSTSLVIGFDIPALGVYASTEIPIGSLLCVRLTQKEQSCTLSYQVEEVPETKCKKRRK